MSVIFGIVFVVAFVSIIVTIVRHARTSPTQELMKMKSAVDSLKDNVNETKQAESDTVTCSYCGTTYDKKQNKCPGCGASRQK